MLGKLGLRRIVRRLESAVRPESFRPADPHTPQAVERAIRHATGTGVAEVGDYYEFGLFRGYTFWHAQKAATESGNSSMRFVGFDSFSGLPEVAGIDAYKGDFATGQYSASYRYVHDNLSRHGVDWSRTILVPGYFADALTPELRLEHAMRPVAVALVDCDLYASTTLVLTFLADLFVDGSVLLFDDWNAFDRKDDHGERRAFREFQDDDPRFAAEPLFEYGIHGQAFLVRKSSNGRPGGLREFEAAAI